MAKFPVVNVGDLWTADLANSFLPDITYKAATTTRASNAVLSDDPDLVTPSLLANGTYLVEFDIRYATTLAAGFQTRWTVPAGIASINKAVQGLGVVGTTGSEDNVPSGTNFAMRQGVHNYATALAFGSRNNVSNQVRLFESSVVIMGATAGPVALQWAQLASTAVNTIVAAGSFVRTTRMS